MKKPLLITTAILVGGIALFLVLTAPFMWDLTHPLRDQVTGTHPDRTNGKTPFIAGDCATCHTSPTSRQGEMNLGGGRRLKAKFGTFHVPNIAGSERWHGAWTTEQFIRAMREGVSPHGDTLYPALPYTSY